MVIIGCSLPPAFSCLSLAVCHFLAASGGGGGHDSFGAGEMREGEKKRGRAVSRHVLTKIRVRTYGFQGNQIPGSNL